MPEKFVSIRTQAFLRKITLRSIPPLFSADVLMIRVGIEESGTDRQIACLSAQEVKQLILGLEEMIAKGPTND